ncbi:MAG TPA: diguanylate cyclase [Caulobacteraceae bacterium]|nr:diguanylate cyclase [Caulobacteraceae bacterium]
MLQAKPRVLIVARDDGRAGPLAEGLDRLGWRTLTARGPYAAASAIEEPSIEAVILDLDGADADALPMARRLRLAGAPRRLPIIGVSDHSSPPAADIDLVLPAPLHADQVAAKLESLVRLTVAEEQLELRRQTFSEHGRALDEPEPDAGPIAVLMAGEPAPQFLALANALRAKGADTVAAISPYNAFEYLHQRQFDAVALWNGAEGSALAIASGMRRNSRLFHMPAVLCLATAEAGSVSELLSKGVTDIAARSGAESNRAARIISLARVHRRQTAIRAALDRARSSGLLDASTGLFTRSLFAAHLAKLARSAVGQARPLSLAVLSLADTVELRAARRVGALDRAIPQIGAMIARLVRAEDTAARLAPEAFAIALPATAVRAADAAAERIAAVIGCTAFEGGAGAAGGARDTFVAAFDIGVAEFDPDEGVAAALERAAKRAGQRLAG